MLSLLLSISLSNKLRKAVDPLSLESFNHAPDHEFDSPVLSHISSLSPFTIPFLDRLDDLLSGAIPLSTFVTPQFWYHWFVYTWEQDPGHLLLEVLCVAIILYLWHRRPYDPRDDERLSPQEEEELIRSWKPESLAAPPPPNLSLRNTPIVSSYSHQHVNIAGRQYVNWVSTNWLGVSSLPQVKSACRETIEKYGVGSCGPRGFYGSFDLHLEVERRLSEFFGGEACILYSDAIATMSSVIPAFSKRGDLIVCDEGCHFGIQQGIRLSRSNVLYYKHNDMDDLERILHQVQEKDMRGHSGKLNRRFIVTEGISQHHGTITPLPHIVRLKQRYKYRLMLDDTMAVGVLGATGRGSLEQWAVDVNQCEFYCASMEASFASVGGFCIGAKQVVDHQRLSGAGYWYTTTATTTTTTQRKPTIWLTPVVPLTLLSSSCRTVLLCLCCAVLCRVISFSASSPPYTVTAAIKAIDYIDEKPELSATLRDKASSMRKLLSNLPGLQLVGKQTDSASPLIHLVLKESSGSRDDDEALLLKMANKVYSEDGMLVHVPEYIAGERQMPPASLQVSVTIEHDDKEMEKLAKALRKAAQEVLGLTTNGKK